MSPLRHLPLSLLTVKAHVLGIGLGQSNINVLLNKMTHSPGVPVYVSTGKALVRHVKEYKEIRFLQGKTKIQLFTLLMAEFPGSSMSRY